MENMFQERMRVKLSFTNLLGARIGNWFEYNNRKYVIGNLTLDKRNDAGARINANAKKLIHASRQAWNPFNKLRNMHGVVVAMNNKDKINYSYKYPNRAIALMRQVVAVKVKLASAISPIKMVFLRKVMRTLDSLL